MTGFIRILVLLPVLGLTTATAHEGGDSYSYRSDHGRSGEGARHGRREHGVPEPQTLLVIGGGVAALLAARMLGRRKA